MRSKIAKALLAETPEDVKIFTKLYASLQVRIHELLQEKGITQKTLAEKLGKQPSEISKWLNGEHNFTLRSLARLQAELGEVLITVPVQKKTAEFKQANISTTITAYKPVQPYKKLPLTWQEATHLQPSDIADAA